MHTRYYEILGVPRTADDKEIKKAFRKLAQQFHPDRNQGDEAAEARFKEVNRAYDVLGDPDKRKLYDEFGEDAEKLGFDADKARAYRQWTSQGNPGFDQGVDLDDILSQMFGGRGGFGGFGGFGGGGPRPPRRGRDVRAEMTLDFRTAVRGGERTIGIDGRNVTVRIPPGVTDGGTLRLRGQGIEGGKGAPAGDLLLTIHVAADPVFGREGDDLLLTLPVTVGEALRGASVEVPTLTGAVKLRVPPDSQSGQVLRLRGKGVARKGRPAGDLRVRLEVRLPEVRGRDVGEALDALEALYDGDVREALRGPATA
ncbi:MAG: DnaJ domain-containing protein [Alphaproteobacteria bacterium]|nr:DnaJ domain-containing protein [Alphaproteobacteria bacterium]